MHEGSFKFLPNIHVTEAELMDDTHSLNVTYLGVCYRSRGGWGRLEVFFLLFFFTGSKLRVSQSLSYSNNNNQPVYSPLSLPSLFSLCAFLISCPGAFIIGQLSSAQVVDWGAHKPTQCHNFAHNTYRWMSPSGPQW